MKIVDSSLNSILENMECCDTSECEKNCRYYFKDDLLHYTYIDNSRFSTITAGKMIAYVSLDYEKLSYGLVANVKRVNGLVKNITLKSLSYSTYWKINPSKCHVFQAKSDNTSFFKDIVDKINIDKLI